MKEKENRVRKQFDEFEKHTAAEMEIDYMGLLYSLLDKAKVIVAAALIGALVMAFYSFVLAKPVYEASCKIYVVSNSDSAINLSDLQLGNYLAKDYLDVFDTWEVREQVISNLNLNYSYKQLSEMLTVTNPADTRILNISIRSGNAKEAAVLANEYAEVASEYISNVMVTDKPTVLSSALEPLSPVAPRKLYNTALGFIAGAAIVIMIIAVHFLLDVKLKSPEDVRKFAGMPVLAIVPSNEDSEIHTRKAVRKDRA